MPDFIPNLAIEGIVASVFVFFIWCYFKWEKGKTNGNEKNAIAEKLRIETAGIAEALRVQNENHLAHISSDINTGFDNIRDCYEAQTTRICQKLDLLISGIGELKGRFK